MNNPVILIIPDIHGRDFYKEAIREAVDKNIEIVCLGDYLDPYFCDVLHEEGVFAPLSELVELKKSRPRMTHLLLGNHDCSYFYSRRVCPSRYDHENALWYHGFFRSNAQLFALFYDTCIAGKRFLFSHAGITNRWLSAVGKGDLDITLQWLKTSLMEFCLDRTKNEIWDYLSHIGEDRGGKEMSGSIIWADFFEHTDPKNQLSDSDVIQIVGHTQLNYNPVRVDNRLFCLDCREPFYIDSDGIVRYYHNDKSIMNTDNFSIK
jgi:hypothetical protein